MKSQVSNRCSPYLSVYFQYVSIFSFGKIHVFPGPHEARQVFHEAEAAANAVRTQGVPETRFGESDWSGGNIPPPKKNNFAIYIYIYVCIYMYIYIYVYVENWNIFPFIRNHIASWKTYWAKRRYMYPRCSMYGIFTYIWVIFGANVGQDSIHGAFVDSLFIDSFIIYVTICIYIYIYLNYV